MGRTESWGTRSASQSDGAFIAPVMHKPVHSPGRREGKMVNKQEVTAAIQEKHQETIEKLNRLWEQYNKEFNENPRKCNKEEYVQKSEYLLGYCSGLMEVCRILVQDIK